VKFVSIPMLKYEREMNMNMAKNKKSSERSEYLKIDERAFTFLSPWNLYEVAAASAAEAMFPIKFCQLLEVNYFVF